MIASRFHKPVTSFVLGVFIATQVLVVGSAVLIPRPAQAILGLGDLVIKIGDVYDVLKDIGIGIAKQMALRVADRFLQKFVNKLQEKYKIRNFLYYDQVLSNYYLNNFIRDKIDDPDLRQIYFMLESAYITGQSTGTTGQPNPRNALIPQLKQKIYEFYLSQGGVPQEYVFSPPRNVSSIDYYRAAQTFWLNPPGFVERNFSANFSEFQSAATTAAQLEIAVGNGIKAGRFVGGTCSLPEGPPNPNVSNPNASPQACAAAGGTWQPSALDQARAFIDNPTVAVESWLNSGIRQIIGNQYDPNNFWAKVGSLLGNFLFNQLTLDREGGVLNEDPNNPYVPGTQDTEGRGIDLDGDGVIDGYDVDNDNSVDICVFGGTAPACTSSVEATTPPPPGSGGTIPPSGPSGLPNQFSVVQAVAGENPDALANSCQDEGGTWEFMDTVVERLHSSDPRWGYNGKRGNVNDLSKDAISYYWGTATQPPHGSNEVYVIDIIGGHCGPNPSPAWQDVTDYSGGTLGAYVYPR